MVDARDWIVIYLKGVCMGSADAVPGVSGGTIALITGIYERLIAAITSIDAAHLGQILSGLHPANLPEARDAFLRMDGPFLLVLGTGIVSAVITVLRIVDYLLSVAPVATFAFFFGLIAASAVVLFGEVDLSTRGRRLAAIAGFLAAFLTSGYATAGLGSGYPVIFLAGAIAVSAMILPGISGSLLLVILGQYEFMSGALSAFVDSLIALLREGTLEPAIETAPPVIVFVAGAVVGLFTVAHAVRRALAAYREATIAFLVSLIVGALRAPVIEVTRELSARGETWGEALPMFVAAALLGAGIVVVLDWYAGAIEY